MNELQMFLQALKQPEYRHVLLTPVPMYGLAMGLLALVLALLLKSRPARVVAMVVRARRRRAPTAKAAPHTPP